MTYKIIKQNGKTVDFCRAETPTPEGCETVVVTEVDCHQVQPMLTEICESLGISFECTFVPYSQSRNKTERIHSLNWQCTLRRRERDFYTFDYSKGSGHCYATQNLKKFTVFKLLSEEVDRWATRQAVARATIEECETGRCPKDASSLKPSYKTPSPSSGELLSSLLKDASCVAYSTFEEFCSELGLDTDSRRAKKMYNECVKTEKALRGVLGSRFEPLIDLANFN